MYRLMCKEAFFIITNDQFHVFNILILNTIIKNLEECFAKKSKPSNLSIKKKMFYFEGPMTPIALRYRKRGNGLDLAHI